MKLALKIVLVLAVLSGVLAGVALNWSRLGNWPGLGNLPGLGKEVRKARVVSGEIRQQVETTALVKAENQRAIYAEIPGKIVSVPVSVGDPVEPETVLARYDSRELALRAEQAQAAFEQAQAQADEAGSPYSEQQLAAARARVEEARTALEAAAANEQRMKVLLEQGAVSRAEYEPALTAYTAARTALVDAEARLKDLEEGAPAYRAQKQAQLQQARAACQLARRELEKATVKAEIKGVVLEKQAEPGLVVSPERPEPLFLLGDPSRLFLLAELVPEDAARIAAGDPVTVTGRALTAGSGAGRVAKIYPAAAVTATAAGGEQRRVPVEIALLAADPGLRPGVRVDVIIKSKPKTGVLLVPKEALFTAEGKDWVYVVAENGRLNRRAVVTGLENDTVAEVQAGLTEGEEVVLAPAN